MLRLQVDATCRCPHVPQPFAVNGGTHTDLLELGWEDFVELEKPQLIEP